MQKGVKDARRRALAVACGPHRNYSCHRKLDPSVRVVAGPVFLLGKRIQSRGGSMALALNVGKLASAERSNLFVDLFLKQRCQ